MQDHADEWIDQNMDDPAPFSRVRFYIRDNDIFQVYFSFVTNRHLNVKSKWISSTTLMIRDDIDRQKLLSLLPSSNLGNRERFDLSIEYEQSDGSTRSSSRNTDIRIERRNPTDSPSWGTDKSVLQFEHWVEASDVPESTKAAREALNKEILRCVGSNLEEYPDHVGNCVIQLEDNRAEAYLEDGWNVYINESLLDPSDIEVVIETREHNELLWRSVATPANVASVDSYEQPEQIEINHESGSETMIFEDFKPPGANEQAIRVLSGGDTITEHSEYLIRNVVSDMTVMSSGQTQSDTSAEPPELYPEHDLSGQPTGVIGEHVWDYRRLDFGTGASRGWTTDSDAGVVDRALSTVRSDLTDVVKIVDPYLEANLLIDFIENLDTGLNIWAITSQLKNKSSVESKLGSFADNGRTVEILRVMDDDGNPSGTPIHDRFIITKNRKSWILGTSFDTLDTNVSVISELPHRVTTSLDRQFNQWWTDPVRKKDGSGDCTKQYLGTSTI